MAKAMEMIRSGYRSETLWPAMVLATSFVATQVVNIIEFVAVH